VSSIQKICSVLVSALRLRNFLFHVLEHLVLDVPSFFFFLAELSEDYQYTNISITLYHSRGFLFTLGYLISVTGVVFLSLVVVAFSFFIHLHRTGC